MHEPPQVSVVITAYNEQSHIRATLTALAADPWVVEGLAEVILVDDRSTDATVAEALAAGLPGLRLLHGTAFPASDIHRLTTRQRALDQGFRAARGQVVLTLDADSTLPAGWVAQMARPVLDGQVAAVAGPIGFLPVSGAVAHWQNCDTAHYHAVAALIAGAKLPSGVFFGNFAFRADLYTALGGFDRIGRALTEDLAFARALGQAGHRIGYAGAPTRVDVQAAPGLSALVDRTMRITQGPVSVLAAVLTLWPLSLLVTLLGFGLWGPWPLIWRYGAGVVCLWGAIWRTHPDRRLFFFALIHEPLVFGLALGVALRKARRKGIIWGGARYD